MELSFRDLLTKHSKEISENTVFNFLRNVNEKMLYQKPVFLKKNSYGSNTRYVVVCLLFWNSVMLSLETVSCLKTALRQFLDVLVLVLRVAVLVLVLELMSRSNEQDWVWQPDSAIIRTLWLYTVSQKKTSHFNFRHNFAICWDIFTIFETFVQE